MNRRLVALVLLLVLALFRETASSECGNSKWYTTTGGKACCSANSVATTPEDFFRTTVVVRDGAVSDAGATVPTDNITVGTNVTLGLMVEFWDTETGSWWPISWGQFYAVHEKRVHVGIIR